MNAQTAIALDAPIDEFDTEEQDAAHTAWIRAELTRRMSAPEEVFPHEQVMAEMKAIIESKRTSA